MHFKISCPYCQHSLSIKDPKPGKYKPKCSGCGEPFAIVVDEGDPPKLKVGKLEKPTKIPPAPSSVPASPTPSLPPRDNQVAIGVEETALEQPSLRSSNQSATPLASIDETFEAISSAPVDHSEVTIGPNIGPPQSNPPQSVSSKPANKDFSVNETSAPDNPANAKAVQPILINRLGGYTIVSELGAGGMGSVYLAKQLSLDRPCALKTIKAHWAQNPKIIARFIREAYAAAQLTHHNVVQIYDLGQDSGTNYFSMELVSGGSLDDQLKAKGKLPPKLAATLILQASRGLKFAHDHGMVHRDIKPANLMMTSDGLLKIADMGLIKTPYADLPSEEESDVQTLMLASARSQVTMVGSSMGTPAYMSPEQSMDAASVDKRADIYSLGCTFYALLTGKPPFGGSTMLEVISKHRAEKLVRPERIISGLPSVLGDVIEKMTEKKPEDRYLDLEDVIHDLEVYLELREDTSNVKIHHNLADARSDEDAPKIKSIASPLDISAEHAGQLKAAIKSFYGSPLLLARRFAPVAWYGLCGAMAALSILFAAWSGISLLSEGAKSLASQATNAVQGLGGVNAGNPNAAADGTQAPVVSRSSHSFASMISWFKSGLGFALALIIAPISAIGFAGAEKRSPLAQRWRESFLASGIIGWGFWLFGALVALMAAYYLGLWLTLFMVSIVGLAAGAGYYFGIEKSLATARKPAIDQAQGVLRQLRLKGMDEQIVRQIIVNHAGKNWEEFFESLLGYDAMRTMRSKLASLANDKDHQIFRSQRDKLIDRLEARIADARSERDEKFLSQTGKAEMIATGVSEDEARKLSETMAATMVEAASETRQTIQDMATGKLTEQAAQDKRQRIRQMMVEARSGKFTARKSRSRSLDRLLSQLLGSKFRFACAAVLLLAAGMWIHSNQQELQDYWQQARSSAQTTMDSIRNAKLDSAVIGNATQALTAATEQAKSAIAQSQAKQWKSVWAGLVHEKNVLFVAIAGLLLLFSTLLYGWKKSLIFIPIALVLCFGPGFIW